MASNERAKLLLAKRNAAAGAVAAFEKFLHAHPEGADLVQLQLRVQGLTPVFANFSEICDELDALGEVVEGSGDRFDILDKYYTVLGAAQQQLAKAMGPTQTPGISTNVIPPAATETAFTMDDGASQAPPSVGGQPGSGENPSTSNNGRKRKIKLPPTIIPKFNGSWAKWLSFKNSFVSLIHRDSELTNMEKLFHLKTSMVGDAEGKLNGFDDTDENYDRAWALLLRSYENKRQLAAYHLHALIEFPAISKDNFKDLQKMADEATQHTQSLAEVDFNFPSEAVVQILEGKLSRTVRAKWEETLKRDQFPTLDQFTEFLYRTAVIMSTQSAQSSRPSDEPHRKRARRDDDRVYNVNAGARSFMTAARGASGSRCICCENESHHLFQCDKFRERKPHQRLKLVEDAGLCRNCLRRHEKDACKHGVCRICGKYHNTLLHLPRPVDDDQVGEKTQ